MTAPKRRFTFLGLMSGLVCALVLLNAPVARAQTAAEDSVLLDPFDPVPEIQFRHFGGDGCWEGCGTRECGGCERCHDGCERHCYSGCYARPHCYRDCDGRVHCERGCHPASARYDRERRFDHDATRVEHDHDQFREDDARFNHDAHEFERENGEWRDRYDDGHYHHDGEWHGGPDGNLDGDHHDAERHEEHKEEIREDRHAEHEDMRHDDGHHDDGYRDGDHHDDHHDGDHHDDR
jgi:hypothetical protein